MHCPQCGGTDLIKRGSKAGRQRYRCRACGRYSTDSEPKFSAQTKAMAIEMYMNSMGIRAIGRVLKASPAAVLTWIRKEHAAVQQRLAEPVYDSGEIVRRVGTTKAYVSFKGRLWPVPQAFLGETLAIRPLPADGRHGIYFGATHIATIDLAKP